MDRQIETAPNRRFRRVRRVFAVPGVGFEPTRGVAPQRILSPLSNGLKSAFWGDKRRFGKSVYRHITVILVSGGRRRLLRAC